MQTTTLSFANLHNHGELFANMLRARRELFIVHNKWNLPEAMGMEYDQYDTPASRWVVVHDEYGQVLAGNRLTPTTTKCGIYSYMIRDAQRGLLETIPSNLLYDEAPVSDEIWESSRLFVAHDVPASIRRQVHARLITEIGVSSRQMGASKCLTLLAATWPRWSKRVNVDMKAMGPVMEIEGIANQVVEMDFSAQLH
ncbi:N-acyl-L-homoserine lactone synthetase [Defluviimonas sp. 20V17]|uniref:N-acyl-L-homoserine lactone synthetase n=1 Tax=Allgaiera indica TaxID=765699 RepID=A0AAN4UXA1_9RHOB|nr:acyl-homoserine-lactone synthase [Allgaiera indica]KDB04829.1 N-acyl-L-homoserine lactone synthetase [Defluviimonas sp. 20V17]GHE05790.1 N-acyl-L-homoserine lactone synthetase [Allgaiera indica]SDX79564.1 N-acyl-L-homoserine lactone synthetase [Allgaiera indica]